MDEQEHAQNNCREAQTRVGRPVVCIVGLAAHAMPRRVYKRAVALLLGLPLSVGACVGSAVESAGASGSDCIADLALELTIGDEGDAAPEYQFASIKSIVVSPSGTIWVVDGEASFLGGPENPLVRQFDPSGKFIGQVGRKGSGPGEYRAPYALALMRDGRVALRDAQLPSRITLYTSEGTLDTTWILDPPRFWPYGGGNALQVDTGAIVWLPFRESARPAPNQRYFFLRMRPDGTVIDTVVPPPIPEPERKPVRITRRLPGGGISIRGITVPHLPRGHWTWSPIGTFATARGDEYRVEVLPPPSPAPHDDATADPQAAPAIVTREVPLVPVPAAEQAEGRRQAADEIASVGGGIATPDMPTQKPPIKAIRFSEDGRLLVWVPMPSRNENGQWTEPSAYDVFDPHGDFECRLVLPESFWMHRMRGDHVWGVSRGEYDVESIRRYRIIWP